MTINDITEITTETHLGDKSPNVIGSVIADSNGEVNFSFQLEATHVQLSSLGFWDKCKKKLVV